MYGVCTSMPSKVWRSDAIRSSACSHTVGIAQAEV